MRSIWLRRLAGLLILVVLAGGAAWLVRRPEPVAPVAGVVRMTEIAIVAAFGGRLATIKVPGGDHARAADGLAELAAPELAAAVGQARAARDVAVAKRDHVYAGVRDEQIAVLAAEIRKAQARITYAEAQHDRVA